MFPSLKNCSNCSSNALLVEGLKSDDVAKVAQAASQIVILLSDEQ
jgi:hypothetical protein